jgi:hypothetical protein
MLRNYSNGMKYPSVTEPFALTGLEFRATDIATGRTTTIPSAQFNSSGVKFESSIGYSLVAAEISRSAYLTIQQANYKVVRLSVYCDGQLMARGLQDLDHIASRMMETQSSPLKTDYPYLFCDRYASYGGVPGYLTGANCSLSTTGAPTSPVSVLVSIDGVRTQQFDKTNYVDYSYRFGIGDVAEGEHFVQTVVIDALGRTEKSPMRNYYGPMGIRCAPEFAATRCQ